MAGQEGIALAAAVIGRQLVGRVGVMPVEYSGLEICAGERSTELVRPPSYRAADGLPEKLIDEVRSIVQHGYTLEVKFNRRTKVTGIPMMVAASIAIAVLLVVTRLFNGLSVWLVLVPWLFLIPEVRDGHPRQRSITSLRGRRVAGNGRTSTQLWQQALAEVDAGQRSEAELPPIHTALLKVANAEDKVNRLVTRNRYALDQSNADLARVDLAAALSHARTLMGLPAIEAAPAPYLANRWAEGIDSPESEPANPDQLR